MHRSKLNTNLSKMNNILYIKVLKKSMHIIQPFMISFMIFIIWWVPTDFCNIKVIATYDHPYNYFLFLLLGKIVSIQTLWVYIKENKIESEMVKWTESSTCNSNRAFILRVLYSEEDCAKEVVGKWECFQHCVVVGTINMHIASPKLVRAYENTI